MGFGEGYTSEQIAIQHAYWYLKNQTDIQSNPILENMEADLCYLFNNQDPDPERRNVPPPPPPPED